MAPARAIGSLRALAIFAETEEPVAPCRICRSNLIEFGDEIKVIMANTRTDDEIATAGELLTRGFTGIAFGASDQRA